MRPLKHPRRVFAITVGLGCALALALSGLLSRPSPPLYTVTDLGVLPGDDVSHASGINNQGEVVGETFNSTKKGLAVHLFLYQRGKMADIGASLLSGGYYAAPAINNYGQVTGLMEDGLGINHAFLDSAGKIHLLGNLPGFPKSYGTGLNDHGDVVGEAEAINPRTGRRVLHAFCYHNGQMRDLGMPTGFMREEATGINNAGQIAGYAIGNRVQAFVQDSHTGRRTILPLNPGMNFAFTHCINNPGQVVGEAFDSVNTHAVLWSHGVMTDMGRLPGAKYMSGNDINDQGEAVGTADIEPTRLGRFVSTEFHSTNPLHGLLKTDWISRAFVFKNGKVTDLNDLIPADSDWTLEEAHGINNQGQIVGWGQHHEQERAFLLTPVR